MSNWSPWTCVRTSKERADASAYEEPVPLVYELGLGREPGNGGGAPQRMYIGETQDGQGRLGDYVGGHSHIEHLIAPKLNAGLALWWRSSKCGSKGEAKGRQDAFLLLHAYPWNTQGVA